ncbi:MAG: hypothetical protein JSW03_02265 [Candidatus Eiseniibacteriota bacterium]|nr:MAG: hypothetical protein JSW03_02265 [Candidatus Eisenbacteria bacterium]
MARNLPHPDWVAGQFSPQGLRPRYRNVVLHASIIEGVLREEVWGTKKKGSFHEAIETLSLRPSGITPQEEKVFTKVKDLRNDLIHDSYRNKYTERQILAVRDKLMEKIREAYSISKFLNCKLFLKYNIDRPASITFKPPK